MNERGRETPRAEDTPPAALPDIERARQFPCAQCGGLRTYTPGTRELECPYCGYVTPIEEHDVAIREHDLQEALEALARAPRAEERIVTQCENCAAEFTFDDHVHAGECPFCGTTIVTGTGAERYIKPRSLLPFRLDESQAREAFRGWLGRLWFAPGGLKRYARGDTRLTGVYVPYWTYDAQTRSRYRGERGDVYYTTVRYTATVNGRPVRRSRRERRVRWSPAAGRVQRFFDDVLVGATKSLPRKITDAIAPWDLDALVPYDPRFLSGFRSEIYQVGLDQGFQLAIEIMDQIIRADVRRDIGGDLQRIHALHTQHSNTTFKHVLLPVWSAAFRYRDRVYRFVVNARSGKTAGQRPYSAWKIAFAVAGGAIVLLLLLVTAEQSGLLSMILSSMY